MAPAFPSWQGHPSQRLECHPETGGKLRHPAILRRDLANAETPWRRLGDENISSGWATDTRRSWTHYTPHGPVLTAARNSCCRPTPAASQGRDATRKTVAARHTKSQPGNRSPRTQTTTGNSWHKFSVPCFGRINRRATAAACSPTYNRTAGPHQLLRLPDSPVSPPESAQPLGGHIAASAGTGGTWASYALLRVPHPRVSSCTECRPPVSMARNPEPASHHSGDSPSPLDENSDCLLQRTRQQ